MAKQTKSQKRPLALNIGDWFEFLVNQVLKRIEWDLNVITSETKVGGVLIGRLQRRGWVNKLPDTNKTYRGFFYGGDKNERVLRN